MKSWTCISYHKNNFSNVSTEKFSRFFKKFYFFRIWSVKFVFRPIEKAKKKKISFIKLHAFMHFFKDFCINEKLGFLLFLCILVKFDLWVFVHASFKHDFHALTSKFSWFIKIFQIRVLMFLRDLGILFNWVKLACNIVWLSDYNMFYTCCVVQLINIRIF